MEGELGHVTGTKSSKSLTTILFMEEDTKAQRSQTTCPKSELLSDRRRIQTHDYL